MEEVGGNKATAARWLGISRRAFYRQRERHGLHEACSGSPCTSTAHLSV